MIIIVWYILKEHGIFLYFGCVYVGLWQYHVNEIYVSLKLKDTCMVVQWYKHHNHAIYAMKYGTKCIKPC